jgi:hypothetical protein
MMPDDLDTRLRRALIETSSTLPPTRPSATDIVGRIRRRRARRNMAATSCAAVVVLAVGIGAYSHTSTSHPEAAAPGVANHSAASKGAQKDLACGVSVTVGAGPSRCAGVFSTAAGQAPVPTSGAASAAQGTNAAASSSVTVGVGGRITVSLPAGQWGAPTPVPLSALPANVRRDFAGDHPAAPPGILRAVTPVPTGARPSPTTAFEAEKPGVVALTATLANACSIPSDAQTADKPAPCAAARTRWTLFVVIAPR